MLEEVFRTGDRAGRPEELEFGHGAIVTSWVLWYDEVPREGRGPAAPPGTEDSPMKIQIEYCTS
jgi:hypothetical protein